MSMRKRLLSLLSVFACLSVLFSSLLCATVAAEPVNVVDDFYLMEAYCDSVNQTTGQHEWLKKTDLNWQYNPTWNGAFTASFGSDLVGVPYNGFKMCLQNKRTTENLFVPEGQYLAITLTGMDVDIEDGSSLAGSSFLFNGWIYDTAGNMYSSRTTATFFPSAHQWMASLLFNIGDGSPVMVSQLWIECDIPSSNVGRDPYTIGLQITAAKTPSEALRLQQETIDKIDETREEVVGKLEETKTGILAKLGDLLSGIVSKLDSVTNGLISDLTAKFNTLWLRLEGLANNILALPGKIWEFIENGLKNLFVPDQNYIANYKDTWELLLHTRLGAVYEAPDLIITTLQNSIKESAATSTITIPQVTIPLPDDNKFSFGPYTVDLIPDGFDAIATTSKTVVGMVCTIAFVNALRKRYDEVIANVVEQV